MDVARLSAKKGKRKALRRPIPLRGKMEGIINRPEKKMLPLKRTSKALRRMDQEAEKLPSGAMGKEAALFWATKLCECAWQIAHDPKSEINARFGNAPRAWRGLIENELPALDKKLSQEKGFGALDFDLARKAFEKALDSLARRMPLPSKDARAMRLGFMEANEKKEARRAMKKAKIPMGALMNHDVWLSIARRSAKAGAKEFGSALTMCLRTALEALMEEDAIALLTMGADVNGSMIDSHSSLLGALCDSSQMNVHSFWAAEGAIAQALRFGAKFQSEAEAKKKLETLLASGAVMLIGRLERQGLVKAEDVLMPEAVSKSGKKKKTKNGAWALFTQRVARESKGGRGSWGDAPLPKMQAFCAWLEKKAIEGALARGEGSPDKSSMRI